MSLSSTKSFMSHSYKIVSVTDQSENYKITNIESKNPTTCWRTSKACEQASFEIRFAPIKLHHIDIITQFSPQIEIEAYNKSDLGGVIDKTQVLPRVTIFNYKEIIEGQMPTKTKRYDLYDKPFLPNITFTHMKITVSNQQHREKPMCLGLNSFILFSRTGDSAIKASPALTFLEQKNREVDEQLLLAVGFNRLQPSASPSKLNTVNLAAEKDRRLSLFKYREPAMSDSRDLHISNVSSSNSNRRNTIGIDTIVPGIKRNWDRNNQENINNLSFYDSVNGSEKKIRPNYTNRDEQYRSNLGRPIGGRRPNDSSQGSNGSGDDELQRAIRESEMSYKKEKERWDQYDNEEIATSKKVTGLRKINETDERTQDMDDFQRAIQESKEMYLQEVDQPKLGMISSMDSQDELNGKAYIEMLERVAEEEEAEIGEIPEDGKEESEAGGQEEMEMIMDDFLVKEKAEKEEDDDAGTEVLEDSMAKLWSTEDDENEVKNKNHDEMEIEERREGEPRIKLTFELGSQNSQGRRNRQLWGRPDSNNMIPLVEKDFYNKYLHMETKARNDAERRKGGVNRVEVVTSYEKILDDVVFCLAGFEGDEKKSLKDLGISMGARFLDDIYANLTTHLVTNDTITKKYKRAKKMKDVIIVSTRWLIECYGQKKRLSEKEFIVNLEDAL